MSARVVALHGFLGAGSDWDAVRRAMRREMEWECPDLFTRGGNDWKSITERNDAAWLVGYSYGGRLALRLLSESPTRWKGVLLLSVNPGNFQENEERVRRRAGDLAWARAFREEPWERLMARWNAQDVLAGEASTERKEADFDREKLARAMEESSVADQTTDATRWSIPLIWMAGERDRKFVRVMESMRGEGFPGEFRSVPNAGHRLLIEAPEAVAQALDDLTA